MSKNKVTYGWEIRVNLKKVSPMPYKAWGPI